MKHTVWSALLLTLCLLPLTSTPVSALEVPPFTACPAPGGTIIASYSDGTHGVPGDPTTYTGSDIVYQLNQSQVVQCLCPPNSAGVQTWWWKAGELSPDDEATLLNQGWIYIPTGATWGLEDEPYYAKNIAYSCTGTGGTGGTGGGSGSGGSSGTSDSSASGTGGSITSGVSVGQVLGAFAATGNIEHIALYAAASLSLFLLSWILMRASRS